MNKVASITKTGLENISLTFEYNSEGNRITGMNPMAEPWTNIPHQRSGVFNLPLLAGLFNQQILMCYTFKIWVSRINKTYSDGKTFNYVYDGINVLKEESSIYNAPAYYLSAGIDQLFARTINNNAEFYLKDAINSLRAVTDSSQGITQSIDYKPFGSVLSGDAGNHSYLYTGREKDFNDVYYYRNRTYSPITGTFHQRDPIGVLGGLNLYSYVRNNPVNYLDPLGLHDDSIDGYYEENFFEPLGDVIQEVAENVENTVNEVSDAINEVSDNIEGVIQSPEFQAGVNTTIGILNPLPPQYTASQALSNVMSGNNDGLSISLANSYEQGAQLTLGIFASTLLTGLSMPQSLPLLTPSLTATALAALFLIEQAYSANLNELINKQ